MMNCKFSSFPILDEEILYDTGIFRCITTHIYFLTAMIILNVWMVHCPILSSQMWYLITKGIALLYVLVCSD